MPFQFRKSSNGNELVPTLPSRPTALYVGQRRPRLHSSQSSNSPKVLSMEVPKRSMQTTPKESMMVESGGNWLTGLVDNDATIIPLLNTPGTSCSPSDTSQSSGCGSVEFPTKTEGLLRVQSAGGGKLRGKSIVQNITLECRTDSKLGMRPMRAGSDPVSRESFIPSTTVKFPTHSKVGVSNIDTQVTMSPAPARRSSVLSTSSRRTCAAGRDTNIPAPHLKIRSATCASLLQMGREERDVNSGEALFDSSTSSETEIKNPQETSNGANVSGKVKTVASTRSPPSSYSKRVQAPLLGKGVDGAFLQDGSSKVSTSTKSRASLSSFQRADSKANSGGGLHKSISAKEPGGSQKVMSFSETSSNDNFCLGSSKGYPSGDNGTGNVPTSSTRVSSANIEENVPITRRRLRGFSDDIRPPTHKANKNVQSPTVPAIGKVTTNNAGVENRLRTERIGGMKQSLNTAFLRLRYSAPRERTVMKEKLSIVSRPRDAQNQMEEMEHTIPSVLPLSRAVLAARFSRQGSLKNDSLGAVISPLADHSGGYERTSKRNSLLAPFNHRDTVDERIEVAFLEQYIRKIDADLSMLHLRRVGSVLSLSRTLRKISLRGCTVEDGDLCGLAEIPCLQVVCVSHTRALKSLTPLIRRRDGLMSNLHEIDAQCSSIGNAGIEGLQKMKRLTRLDLSMTLVTNVTSLSKSQSLVELLLTGTHVTSEGIAGLEKIPTLKALEISRTKVESLHGIAKSLSLETLKVYSCHVTDSDLRGVELLPRLKTIDISTTKVTNLSVLSASVSLISITAQWLSLLNCGNAISIRRSKLSDNARVGLSDDGGEYIRSRMLTNFQTGTKVNVDPESGFRGLAKIPTLMYLDLSHNMICSVRSLFASKSITTLVLRCTRIESDGINGIQQMRSLKTLIVSNATEFPAGEDEMGSQSVEVSGTFVSVSDLSFLLNLVVLDLSFTDVYDIRGMSSLPHLQELYLVETLVTVDGLWGIERIQSLRILDISQTSVLSLLFLSSGCPMLQRIIAKANRNVRGFRIGNVGALPALEVLDVSDTVVEDINMLFDSACCLKQLIWRWGERRDSTGLIDSLFCWVKTPLLKGIEKMPQLEVLDLSQTSISSVSFLSESKSLKRLILSRCSSLNNDGILGLEKIPTLEVLDISYVNGISDVRCLCASPSLQELQIGWTSVTMEGLGSILQKPSLRFLDVTFASVEEELVFEIERQSGMPSLSTVVSQVSEGLSALDSRMPCDRSLAKPPKSVRNRCVSFLS